MRVFFALWPDPHTRSALSGLQALVRGRHVHPADLHLTLAFLGQQPASLLPVLKDVLAHLPSCDISLIIDRIGYFSRNRIAWAGAHDLPAPLAALHENLVAGLLAHGVAYGEERTYKPHITLARDAEAPADVIFSPFTWRAREVTLVMSAEEAAGARYRVLARRMLDEVVRLPDPGEDAPTPGRPAYP